MFIFNNERSHVCHVPVSIARFEFKLLHLTRVSATCHRDTLVYSSGCMSSPACRRPVALKQ